MLSLRLLGHPCLAFFLGHFCVEKMLVPFCVLFIFACLEPLVFNGMALPLMSVVLSLITPLHSSNTELLVYLIPDYENSHLHSFSDVCCFYLAFFFFLTYLLSFYLPRKAQRRWFLLSEAPFPSLGTKLISLSSTKPLHIFMS